MIDECSTIKIFSSEFRIDRLIKPSGGTRGHNFQMESIVISCSNTVEPFFENQFRKIKLCINMV